MTTEPNLKKELATYEQKQAELVAAHQGKFVLIHGDEVAGTWDTYEDALKAGYERFDLEPFLVKWIQGVEQVHCFSRDLGACQS